MWRLFAGGHIPFSRDLDPLVLACRPPPALEFCSRQVMASMRASETAQPGTGEEAQGKELLHVVPTSS